MIYKIVSLALLATIISINKNDAKKWKYCEPCGEQINDLCCERPADVWQSGKGKKLCCEFPEKNQTATYFKPEPCYSECVKTKGVDIQQGQDKGCMKKCTRGLREPCTMDKDCHKWNDKMICVNKHKVVEMNNGTTLNVSSYDHEIIPGQCHYGLPTIVELAKSTPTLSKFTDVLEQAALVNTLNGEGPFTVFAPSDKAFAKIPHNDYVDLLKPENVENLKKKLLNHVVGGKYDFTKLREGNPIDLPTKGGKKITVDKCHITVCIKSSGKEYEILTSDIEASNGIIHIIRKVLKV